MTHLYTDIYKTLPKATQAAIDELEARGLKWGVHFGSDHATGLLLEMNAAFAGGTLYQWLRDRMGVVEEKIDD